MTAKSSIHIAGGSGGYFAHNSRESWSKSQVFFDEENELWNSQKDASEIFRAELKIRSEIYTNSTKQKLQKNAIVHLSAVVNLNENHTLEDLKPIVEHLENSLDTKVTQLGIHRDEGKLISKIDGHKLVSGEDFFANQKDEKLYYDEGFQEPIDMDNFEVEKNYHAHIEMMGIDSKGMAIKRNRLNKIYLQHLQTLTANTLKMERGKYNLSYTKEQITEIRSRLKPEAEYKNKTEYAKNFNKVAKALGYFINKEKRLNTHEFKARAKAQNDAIKEQLTTIKDINELNRQLSGKLTDANAWEAKYEKLKSKVKTKALTIAQLKNELALTKPVEVENPINIELQTNLDKLNIDLNEKDAQISSYETKINLDTVKLESLEQELKSAMQTIENQKELKAKHDALVYNSKFVINLDEDNNPFKTKQTWKDEAEEIRNRLDEFNQDIIKLDEQIVAKDERIDVLETENSKLDSIVDSLTTRVEKLTTREKELISNSDKPKTEEEIRDNRIKVLENIQLRGVDQQEELEDLIVAKYRDKNRKKRGDIPLLKDKDRQKTIRKKGL